MKFGPCNHTQTELGRVAQYTNVSGAVRGLRVKLLWSNPPVSGFNSCLGTRLRCVAQCTNAYGVVHSPKCCALIHQCLGSIPACAQGCASLWLPISLGPPVLDPQGNIMQNQMGTVCRAHTWPKVWWWLWVSGLAKHDTKQCHGVAGWHMRHAYWNFRKQQSSGSE